MKRSVTVVVAGQRFTLKTEARENYIKELADYVGGKIEEVRGTGRTVTTQSMVLLAAMNIADELHQLRTEQRTLKQKVREKSKRILSFLDPR